MISESNLGFEYDEQLGISHEEGFIMPWSCPDQNLEGKYENGKKKV